MLKEINGRLIYDCGHCGENLFDVPSSENIGDPPHTIICSGCGSRYTAQLNAKGELAVYRGRGRKFKQQLPEDKDEDAPGDQEGQEEEPQGKEEPGKEDAGESEEPGEEPGENC